MPKKNTPVDLADALFMQIERLDDPSLEGEALEAEIQRTDAMCRLSTQVIANGRLALDVHRFTAEHGRDLANVPNVLGGDTAAPAALPSGRRPRALPAGDR